MYVRIVCKCMLTCYISSLALPLFVVLSVCVLRSLLLLLYVHCCFYFSLPTSFRSIMFYVCFAPLLSCVFAS